MSFVALPDSDRSSLDQGQTIDDGDERYAVALVCKPKLALPSLEALCQRQLAGEAPLDHDEFEARYGPGDEARAAIEAFAREFGLTLTTTDNPTVIELSGTVAELRAAFRLDLERKRLPDSQACFLSHTEPIKVPAALFPHIEWVFGLSMRRAVERSRLHLDHAELDDSSLRYTSTELADIYSYPGPSPSGHTSVGVIELAGHYRPEDVTQYLDMLGVSSRPTLINVGSNDPSLDQLSNLEVAMDVQLIASLIGANTLVVYNAQSRTYSLADYFRIFSRAVFDRVNKPKVLSNSWSWPELPEIGPSPSELRCFDSLFTAAALLGITICSSTGDAGAMFPVPNGAGTTTIARVNFPASSPLVLGCGGTTLVRRQTEPESETEPEPEIEETVWNSLAETLAVGPDRSSAMLGNGMASTGGVSVDYGLPPYQAEARVPKRVNRAWLGGRLTKAQLSDGRGVPDVVANANLNTGYIYVFEGGEVVGGGTSAAAPMWAALIGQINTSLARPVGLLNPVIYALQADAGPVTRQIVHGSNGAYMAGPGLWNACSGLGAPIGTALREALAARDDQTSATTTPNDGDSDHE